MFLFYLRRLRGDAGEYTVRPRYNEAWRRFSLWCELLKKMVGQSGADLVFSAPDKLNAQRTTGAQSLSTRYHCLVRGAMVAFGRTRAMLETPRSLPKLLAFVCGQVLGQGAARDAPEAGLHQPTLRRPHWERNRLSW